MAGLSAALGEAGTVVVSVALATAVLACLTSYGAASVDLSTVSAMAVGQWAVTATYLEESGEALVSVAVLVGVASHLVNVSRPGVTRTIRHVELEISGAMDVGKGPVVHAPGEEQVSSPHDSPSRDFQSTTRRLLRAVDDSMAPPTPMGPLCTCGHGRTAHEHHRRGMDCALCECGSYRRHWWFRRGRF
jgi:hypothetical protein